MALDTLIVKFAAPCNLACTYCYEYSSGDETWRTKPKFLSQETARQIGALIRAYTSKHDLSAFKVVAHGGEPLLMGPSVLTKHSRPSAKLLTLLMLNLACKQIARLSMKTFAEYFEKMVL